MTIADLPGKADSEGWRRVHPLTPLIQGGLVLIVIAGILIANLRDRFIEIFVGDEAMNRGGDIFDVIAENGLVFAVLGGVLAVVAVIVLFSWLSWRVHTYRITDVAVENREGLVFKKHRRAPLERIQSVNLQRPLIARIAGLTKIAVQTAGQGGQVELAYLTHHDAKTVREQILRRAQATQELTGADELEATETAATAERAAAFDGTAYAEPGGALSKRLHEAVDFDIDAQSAAGALVRVPVARLIGSLLLSWEIFILLGAVIGAIVASIWQTAALTALIPAILVFGGILIAQFNKGFNFVLSRYGEGVRTGSGLTATVTESIPFGRIHAIEARQPLGWRPLGWWRVRITTAGHSVAEAGQNQNQNVVLPVGTEADVLHVLETLLPGVAGDETGRERLEDALVGAGDGYLRSGPRAGWVLWFGKKRAGIQIHRSEQQATLRVRRGALNRSLIVMPLVRAQSVQLRRPLVHRMIGLASVSAHTVLGPVSVTMRGIELAAARSLFSELAASVVAEQLSEADGGRGASS